ncbi:MAG: helix-turn-helix domain-containing protein [Candidatus Riflebacteria bacterium]|nr:helix-turn-helix domain-containing protein [Candidatus Riflebacteria bacterium]
MNWQGEKLRELLRQKGFTQASLAEKLKVSRQAVIDWLNGTIPKGSHLLALCQLFEIAPDLLFSESVSEIVLPVHRKRGNSHLTNDRQALALELSKKYELFYKHRPRVKLHRAIRFPSDYQEKDILELPSQLRQMAGARDYSPLKIEQTFRLLECLGVDAIFYKFPDDLKSYAFYTEIFGYPVVFINTSNNLLDVSFPILHEAIHALCGTASRNSSEFSDTEESLCDKIASQVLFTSEYVREVQESIEGLSNAQKINELKKFGAMNHHPIYGIVKRLKESGVEIKFPVGGADTNLQKKFPSLGEKLFSHGDAKRFIENLSVFSPLFYKELRNRMDSISDRLLAEWLGLESTLDAGEVRKFIQDIPATSIF